MRNMLKRTLHFMSAKQHKNKKRNSRLLAALLAVCLVLGGLTAMPTTASAATTVNITTLGHGSYTVNDGEDIEFTGTNEDYVIWIAENATAAITLSDVTASSINLQGYSNVTVTLIGTNTLTNGISGNSTVQMTIEGDGSLDTTNIRVNLVTVSSGEVKFTTTTNSVNENLKVTGGIVDVAGNITGNLEVTGGEVNVMGTIGGNLDVSGGNVTTGNVNGDVTVSGGTVTTGTVGGMPTHTGGTYNGKLPDGTTPTDPGDPTDQEPTPTDNSGGSSDSKKYNATSGSGATWTGSGDVTWEIDAPFNKFKRLQLGGNTIDGSNYSAYEGSTIITLSESYIKTLPGGTHSFRAVFSDGWYADLTLIVSTDPNAFDDVPKTGVDSNYILWIIICIVSFALIIATSIKLFKTSGKRQS